NVFGVTETIVSFMKDGVVIIGVGRACELGSELAGAGGGVVNTAWSDVLVPVNDSNTSSMALLKSPVSTALAAAELSSPLLLSACLFSFACMCDNRSHIT